MDRYQGEMYAQALYEVFNSETPACMLAVQAAETDDLCQRLAALLETGLVTRAMDFSMDADGKARAIRPVANGYLFEAVELDCRTPPIVSFLPSVLFDTEPDQQGAAEVISHRPEINPANLKTRVVEVIEAAPEDLDLEEADIIVAGGRGVGKGDAFNIVHELAKVIGGSVGATRPIIDWGTLPYERQIGQTGKYVAPRLIVNCGISGANEYTAGMEKSQRVVAIDKNPRVRMFRFADLGIVGDVHEILPLLISQIEDRK
jgi:electron transfer flavoprotein alpha subunit